MKQEKKTKLSSKAKGFLKELAAARYLIRRGWTILEQNKKIFGVEVDILAKKGPELAIVEVKSIAQAEHLENILKSSQKERLKKAAEALSSGREEGVRLFLAAVNKKNQVELFDLI